MSVSFSIKSFLIPIGAWHDRRQMRRAFQRAREQRLQPDVDFANSILRSLSDFDRETAITIRRLVALQCGLQGDCLRDDDQTGELEAMIGQTGIIDFILAIQNGLDFTEFYLRLEKDIATRSGGFCRIADGVRIAGRRLWSGGGYDFGQWTAWLVGKSTAKIEVGATE